MTTDNSQVTLQAADPLGTEATQLLQAMRAEALRRYSDVIDPSSPPPANDPLVPRSAFLLAWHDGQPIGCAALRPIDEELAEIRRMYVSPAMRRRGIGRHLLRALEHTASAFGYRALRLETGPRQPEAVALYESYGFRRIPSYGRYIGDPLSICFEKRVARDETLPPGTGISTPPAAQT